MAQRRGRVEGKVAVVTGASSGIGAAAGVLLAAEGAKVALLARREAELQAVAKQADAAGGEALAVPCDVTDPRSVDAAAAKVAEAFGPAVHVLFNNAGGATMAPVFPVEPLDAWNQVLTLNLTGTLLVTQALWPALEGAGGASVVNMSSYAAVSALSQAQRSRLPGVPPASYAASKAGVEALTRYAASVGAPSRIRANVVRPGQILTDTASYGGRHVFNDYFADVQLTEGAGLPDHVAATVLFLASEESAFINGQVIDIDGGAAGKV